MRSEEFVNTFIKHYVKRDRYYKLYWRLEDILWKCDNMYVRKLVNKLESRLLKKIVEEKRIIKDLINKRYGKGE